MELEEVPTAITEADAAAAFPPSVAGGPEPDFSPSSPPRDPDLAAAGSSEDTTLPKAQALSSEDDGEREGEPDHGHDDHSSGTVVLSADDLKQKIIKQVEYYFSDENLPTDKYLLGFVKKNKEGFVPIGVIASFRKVKKLTRDYACILAALKESTFLVVSSDGKKVKRLHPLPVIEHSDPKLFTVLVENLPDDHSVSNLRKIFGEVGHIRSILVHDPNAAEESKKGSRTEKLHSTRLHALVEYDAVKSAEKAANTLNNEQDWRNGMRVKLLKRVGMYGYRRQGCTGPDTEKRTPGPDTEKKTAGRLCDHAGDGEHKANEHHEDVPDEEGVNHAPKSTSGDRARNHGRARKLKHRGLNGHGHGTTAPSHSIETSKPPPGPRMPDGTRGFTMGRGRPLSTNQS